MRESKESRQNPSRSFWGEEKMKKKKHLQRKVEMEWDKSVRIPGRSWRGKGVTKREGPYSPRLDDRIPDDFTRLQVQHSHTEYTQNFTHENSSWFNYWTYTSESTSSLARPQTPMTSSCILSLKIFCNKTTYTDYQTQRKDFGNQQIIFYHSSGMLPPSLLLLLTLFYSLLSSPTLPPVLYPSSFLCLSFLFLLFLLASPSSFHLPI